MCAEREEHWTVKAFRLGSAGALLLSQAGCLPRGQKNPDASPPPTTSSEITPAISPPVTSPATEISPSSGVGETIVIAEQRYMSQQEVLAVDPVESKFQKFQEEIKANNPSATFAAWGALATAQTGETYFTPFFEVYNDGNLVSEYVNIGKIDGSIATLELKPGEVEGPDGKIYVSLSQTVNADTNELLETPLPYIWIPYSRAEYNALPDDEKAKVPVYFSAIPGIVPQNEAPVYDEAKTANIRMIIATSTPEALLPLPQEFLSQIPKDSYTYDANGLHITIAEGRVIDIPQDQIAEKFQGKVFILDLNQQSESGYQLGVVWRDNQWRETFINFPFETNGENINNLPNVALEDITSGRLAEAERLASQPFPEGVEPLNNYYYDSNFGSIYPNLDPQTGYEFSLHPEKFPMRFAYFYQAEINNIPLVVATLQVLNQDYSSVFIHKTISSKGFIDDIYRDWWKGQIRLQLLPSFNMALGGDKYDVCKNSAYAHMLEAEIKVVCPLNAPRKGELQEAMQELVEKQSIPQEFERELFIFDSGPWY